jgi:hypothetical protein
MASGAVALGIGTTLAATTWMVSAKTTGSHTPNIAVSIDGKMCRTGDETDVTSPERVGSHNLESSQKLNVQFSEIRRGEHETALPRATARRRRGGINRCRTDRRGSQHPPDCTYVSGSLNTQCQTPGNAQINDSPSVMFGAQYPYWWGGYGHFGGHR